MQQYPKSNALLIDCDELNELFKKLDGADKKEEELDKQKKEIATLIDVQKGWNKYTFNTYIQHIKTEQS